MFNVPEHYMATVSKVSSKLSSVFKLSLDSELIVNQTSIIWDSESVRAGKETAAIIRNNGRVQAAGTDNLFTGMIGDAHRRFRLIGQSSIWNMPQHMC